MAWSESGDHLYIAGDTSLMVVARSDLKTYTVAQSILHAKEISLVSTLAHPSCFATIGLDKMVKIWRAKTDDSQLKE